MTKRIIIKKKKHLHKLKLSLLGYMHRIKIYAFQKCTQSEKKKILTKFFSRFHKSINNISTINNVLLHLHRSNVIIYQIYCITLEFENII